MSASDQHDPLFNEIISELEPNRLEAEVSTNYDILTHENKRLIDGFVHDPKDGSGSKLLAITADCGQFAPDDAFVVAQQNHMFELLGIPSDGSMRNGSADFRYFETDIRRIVHLKREKGGPVPTLVVYDIQKKHVTSVTLMTVQMAAVEKKKINYAPEAVKQDRKIAAKLGHNTQPSDIDPTHKLTASDKEDALTKLREIRRQKTVKPVGKIALAVKRRRYTHAAIRPGKQVDFLRVKDRQDKYHDYLESHLDPRVVGLETRRDVLAAEREKRLTVLQKRLRRHIYEKLVEKAALGAAFIAAGAAAGYEAIYVINTFHPSEASQYFGLLLGGFAATKKLKDPVARLDINLSSIPTLDNLKAHETLKGQLDQERIITAGNASIVNDW